MDLLAFATVVVTWWAIGATVEMTPRSNRPKLLRNETLFTILMTMITISIGSTLIWMALTIEPLWWLKGPAIVLLGVGVANWLYPKLPLWLNGSAIGYYLWVFAIAVANVSFWTVLRPS